MKIKEYSELTDFCYEEYVKMHENFGIQNPSKSFIRFNERSLKKYIKLYDKPLYKRAKRELALQEAIDTMPHGFLWKFFNNKLWQKIKLMETENSNEIEPKTETASKNKTLYPSIVKATSLEVVSEDE